MISKETMRGLFMANTYTYSKREEVANAITHGIGALLSVAALIVLIVFSTMKGTAWHIVSFSVYGTTMLILYLNSTLVHSFKEGKIKDLFEIFDHSSIYLFIAKHLHAVYVGGDPRTAGLDLVRDRVGDRRVGLHFQSLFYETLFIYVDDILSDDGLDGRRCLGAAYGGRGVRRNRFARGRGRALYARNDILRLARVPVPSCHLAFIRARRQHRPLFRRAGLFAPLVVKRLIARGSSLGWRADGKKIGG